MPLKSNLIDMICCTCRCYRSDVKVTGPHSPAEEHVNYEIVAGYVKVSAATDCLQAHTIAATQELPSAALLAWDYAFHAMIVALECSKT